MAKMPLSTVERNIQIYTNFRLQKNGKILGNYWEMGFRILGKYWELAKKVLGNTGLDTLSAGGHPVHWHLVEK